MINLDISNVWTCVSLPELLGNERELFEAHSRLRNNQLGGPDFLGWLGLPDSITARLIHGIRRRADQICNDCDILVVCGSGSAFEAARAAVECYCGSARNLLSGPQIYFTGDSLCGRQWVELSRLLEDKDYALHLISPDGSSLATNVTARGLRWMMERKYGPKTKERISVATNVGTPLHKMGQEEGYELFPMPRQMGGSDSGLSAAAMIPMAVAGIDPLSVLEGAADSYQSLDVRSFDNPSWLYAGTRHLLLQKGHTRELMCFFDHSLTGFGRWWQRYVWQHECRLGRGICPQTILLPGDLDTVDDMISTGDGGVFETLVHFDPISKQIPVEMDWKDYDGLGFLSGRNLDYVEAQTMNAMVETHNFEGVPVLDVQAGELTAQSLGELLYFFELSSALTAQTNGVDPFVPGELKTLHAALKSMEQP